MIFGQEIEKIIKELEIHQMRYFPERYLRKYISSTKDIYEYRHVLKATSFDNESIKYLLTVIVTDLEDNKRFKKQDCLKVIKKILKNRLEEVLDSSIIRHLFYIYQYFILFSNDDIQWCVSTFIKDQLLNNEDIQWLIDNFEESEHLVNRLIKYPVSNNLITNWAQNIYNIGLLEDRISQVIAILIEDQIPNYVTNKSDTLIWALYFSKCSNETKERLLLSILDVENYSQALEVASRLELPSISESVLQHYYNLLENKNIERAL